MIKTHCSKKGCGETRATKTNPYCKEHSRQYAHRNRYKISEEELEELVSIKECQICGEDISGKGPTGRVKVRIDHCHKTNKIRGVLCNNCNTALGKFKDDIGLLANAIKYLSK